jgi:hypothetical protein
MNALVRAQRDRRMVPLQKALDTMARRNAVLLQEFNPRSGEPRWYVTLAGEVSAATAEKIRERPDVRGEPDAMFPGMHQTWRMVR